MKKFSYLSKYIKWIQLYHFAIFKSNKNLNTEAFTKFQLKNTKYTIFVITDPHEIGIYNLDIKFLV